jgi:hypothetical protein
VPYMFKLSRLLHILLKQTRLPRKLHRCLPTGVLRLLRSLHKLVLSRVHRRPAVEFRLRHNVQHNLVQLRQQHLQRKQPVPVLSASIPSPFPFIISKRSKPRNGQSFQVLRAVHVAYQQFHRNDSRGRDRVVGKLSMPNKQHKLYTREKLTNR